MSFMMAGRMAWTRIAFSSFHHLSKGFLYFWKIIHRSPTPSLAFFFFFACLVYSVIPPPGENLQEVSKPFKI